MLNLIGAGIRAVTAKLRSRVVYVGNGAISLASWPSRADRDLVQRPWVIIAGRSICFEVHVDIPSSNASEALNIALKMPVESPFQEAVRRVRVLPNGDEHVAHITLIERTRLDVAGKLAPFFLIPLSWITRDVLSGESGILTLPDEKVAFTKRGESERTALVLEDKDTDDGTMRQITWEDKGFVSVIVSALFNLHFSDWMRCLCTTEFATPGSTKRVDTRKVLRLSLISAAGYLAISSAVLLGLSLITGLRLSEEPQEFTAALKARSQALSQVEELQRITDMLGPQRPVWELWPPLVSAIDAGSTVRSVKYNQGAVEVVMTGQDASAILQILLSSPFVDRPSFSAPIVKNPASGLETFSISWGLPERSPT